MALRIGRWPPTGAGRGCVRLMLQMQIELEFETGREGTGRIDACARVDPIETAD